MAITETQLAAKFEAALKAKSDDPNVDIEDARKHLAKELAEGVAQFVIGRETTVVGVQNGSGTTTGTIL
ncbi:MAG: hypothetical protein V7767_00665 [Leeuwenhoekiella sp.]